MPGRLRAVAVEDLAQAFSGFLDELWCGFLRVLEPLDDRDRVDERLLELLDPIFPLGSTEVDDLLTGHDARVVPWRLHEIFAKRYTTSAAGTITFIIFWP